MCHNVQQNLVILPVRCVDKNIFEAIEKSNSGKKESEEQKEKAFHLFFVAACLS